MRVLHIVQTLKGGGAETLIREMIPRLRQRGIIADALCMYRANLSPEEETALGCSIVELDRKGSADFSAPIQMIRAIRRYRPDVVHTHVATGKYWGRACAVLAGVPIIIHTEHSPLPRLLLWEWPANYVLNQRTNAVVTFSQRTAEFVRLRERAPNLRIIPNGIEVKPPPTGLDRALARQMLSLPTESIAIGVVANFYPHKNPGLALEAFCKMKMKSGRPSSLHYFGAGALENQVKQMAESMGLDRDVIFHGFVSDVRSVLPGLDIFLSVSYSEAAPISFLEAMSACLPIVATPSIGALDMVQDPDTGIVSKSYEVSSVSDALRRAVDDAQWRVEAGKRARVRLEQEFDIELVADRHAALYEELVG